MDVIPVLTNKKNVNMYHMYRSFHFQTKTDLNSYLGTYTLIPRCVFFFIENSLNVAFGPQ